MSSYRRTHVLLVVVVAVLWAGCAERVCTRCAEYVCQEVRQCVFVVEAVCDGDTFKVVCDGELTRVRIKGIQAPARSRPEGKEAEAALAALIQGEKERLEFGPAKRDGRGRLLARVLRERDGLDVGAELLRQGHAQAWTKPAKR